MFCKKPSRTIILSNNVLQKNHHNTIVKQCFAKEPSLTILLSNNVLQKNITNNNIVKQCFAKKHHEQ